MPTATPQPEGTPVHTANYRTHSGDGTGLNTPCHRQAPPADQIKGRMTLREVSDQCAVPLDDCWRR
jgi:hypothetical protein